MKGKGGRGTRESVVQARRRRKFLHLRRRALKLGEKSHQDYKKGARGAGLLSGEDKGLFEGTAILLLGGANRREEKGLGEH